MLALAAIRPGDYVLDIACGTGLVTFRAAEMTGPQGRVVGVDISNEMVERAKRRAAELNIANVSFERSGAEDLPLEDNSFGVVLSALGLMYVPEPNLAVAEMHRTLKRGGKAAAAVWGRRENCGWAAIFSIVDVRVKTEVCPLFFQLGTGESLKRTFERAGLEPIAMERINTILRYGSAEEALSQRSPAARWHWHTHASTPQRARKRTRNTSNPYPASVAAMANTRYPASLSPSREKRNRAKHPFLRREERGAPPDPCSSIGETFHHPSRCKAPCAGRRERQWPDGHSEARTRPTDSQACSSR